MEQVSGVSRLDVIAETLSISSLWYEFLEEYLLPGRSAVPQDLSEFTTYQIRMLTRGAVNSAR
jgi:hypothetical protein